MMHDPEATARLSNRVRQSLWHACFIVNANALSASTASTAGGAAAAIGLGHGVPTRGEPSSR
jgi:hypothetical protein